MIGRTARRSWFGIACILWCSFASAQSSSDQQTSAKELFERGKAAMAVGRFAEAQEHFSQSLALVPKASAAFNLAVSFRGTGKPKEAAQVLEGLVAGKYGAVPPEMRGQATQLEKEARRDIAILSVVQTGAPRATVRVDGSPAGTALEGIQLLVQVNPGERLVSVSAPLRSPRELRVAVAAGQSKRVATTLVLSRAARMSTLELVAKDPKGSLEIVGVARGRGRIVKKLEPGKYQVRLRSDAGDRDTQIELRPATRHRVELEPEKGGVFQSPWFWAAAGTLTVGAAVGGYFLLRDPREDPVRDPEFSVVETLGATHF